METIAHQPHIRIRGRDPEPLNLSVVPNFIVGSGGKNKGGWTDGPGFTIQWDAALGRGPRDGAYIEDVILAAIQRLEHYESGPGKCAENKDAIDYLRQAVQCLAQRQERLKSEHAVAPC